MASSLSLGTCEERPHDPMGAHLRGVTKPEKQPLPLGRQLRDLGWSLRQVGLDCSGIAVLGEGPLLVLN